MRCILLTEATAQSDKSRLKGVERPVDEGETLKHRNEGHKSTRKAEREVTWKTKTLVYRRDG